MSEGCGSGCGCSAHKKTEAKSTEAKSTEAKSGGATKAVAQNGKGDAPRNISEKFRRNYDTIRWS